MAFVDPIATLRRRIPDLDSNLFQDDELTGFLDDEGGDVLSALADIWETIAGSQLLLFKADVTSDDGAVTASAMAAQFRARAAALRADIALSVSDGFDIIGGETIWG